MRSPTRANEAAGVPRMDAISTPSGDPSTAAAAIGGSDGGAAVSAATAHAGCCQACMDGAAEGGDGDSKSHGTAAVVADMDDPLQGFQLDAASGLLYNSDVGFYFDPATQHWRDAGTGDWYRRDASGALLPMA
uniref:OCRE domain-containing protein n=1 Tax=Chlamydomonas euryale TaxID=1486919 RepID=A0A7R9YZ02_9CHLO